MAAPPSKSPRAAGYHFIGEIGMGSRSQVRLARDGSGRARCVKCINKSTLDPKVDDPTSEYELMRECSAHPCIAMALDFFQDAGVFYIVQEHLEGGDFTTLSGRARRVGA